MTNGAGTAYPSGVPVVTLGVRGVRVALSLVFYVYHCLSFYFWPLYCLWKKCHKFVDMNVMYFFFYHCLLFVIVLSHKILKNQ